MSMIEDDMDMFDVGVKKKYSIGRRSGRVPTTRVSDLPRGGNAGQHRPSYAPGIDSHDADYLEPISVRCGSCRSQSQTLEHDANKKKKNRECNYGAHSNEVHHTAGKVRDTTGMNVNELKNAMKVGSYMLIKADWCSHCKRAIPEYEKIAMKNPNQIFLMHDGEVGSKALNDAGLDYKGYPTVYKVQGEGFEKFESFGAFMKKFAPPQAEARDAALLAYQTRKAPHHDIFLHTIASSGANAWYEK